MNVELIMACFVLYSGLSIVYKILKMGSPENALKNKIESIEKFKKSIKSKGAYLIAYFLGLAIGVFLVYVSLLWFIPHFK